MLKGKQNEVVKQGKYKQATIKAKKTNSANRANKANEFAKAAVAAIIALGISSQSATSHADEKMEKCYGIVKKGKNDCAAHNHSCQGQASNNSDPSEWIFLPSGSCNKIVGGSTTPPPK